MLVNTQKVLDQIKYYERLRNEQREQPKNKRKPKKRKRKSRKKPETKPTGTAVSTKFKHTKDWHGEFASLSTSLHALGFKSLDAYLRSKLWRPIRGRVLRRDEQCVMCYAVDGLHVHHTSYNYEAMAGKDDSWLVTVCSNCHQQAHETRGSSDVLQSRLLYHDAIRELCGNGAIQTVMQEVDYRYV